MQAWRASGVSRSRTSTSNFSAWRRTSIPRGDRPSVTRIRIRLPQLGRFVSLMERGKAPKAYSACPAQDFLSCPHSLAQLGRIAKVVECPFEGREADNDVGFIGVSQVGQAEDLSLDLGLPARDGDSVGRPELLDDGACLDTWGDRDSGKRGGWPLGEQFEPERGDAGAGGPCKSVMPGKDGGEALPPHLRHRLLH